MRDELERPAGHYAVKKNVEAEDQQWGASIHELGLCGRLIWGNEPDNDQGAHPCLGAPPEKQRARMGSRCLYLSL